ncbi:MAG: 50S ribosomal protein L21, partial [Candidatus Saccharimonadales bacterium]
MNKAVITTGGKQYLVKEGETLEVELLNSAEQKISFVPLLVIKEDAVMVGQPLLEAAVVSAEVIDADKKADKVTAI